ncbi:hypothetical protein KP509_13G042300 [Ceratopteris richardii]|uniref:Uncharacterized protein n=1 Tax=Ceratopteris richardii TaxID=49495 RepID=A0A8T2TI94_CERRI|nr:hypothetical protein KP509_13G042300 [Ceratopteris richardii]KAH7421146.1 hypothetical protein KP509_13G042300 [Ceratopteris richardii]
MFLLLSVTSTCTPSAGRLGSANRYRKKTFGGPSHSGKVNMPRSGDGKDAAFNGELRSPTSYQCFLRSVWSFQAGSVHALHLGGSSRGFWASRVGLIRA